MKIAILYICTGKYAQFFQGFYESSEKYFLKDRATKDYFVFTDCREIMASEHVHVYEKQSQGFPLDSLLRFEQFLRVKKELQTFDYVFFFNANAKFVRSVEREILPQDGKSLVAGVWKQNLPQSFFLPYERNKKSRAYIPPHDGPYTYYGGFFNGGTGVAFVEMAEQLAQNTRIDMDNDIIAKVHDESHLNWYLHNHSCTALPTEYIIPEEFLKKGDNPYMVLRDKVSLDQYFNKGRKHTIGARVKKLFEYIKNAIIWYI